MSMLLNIEGNPFIIRFKTKSSEDLKSFVEINKDIEGNPFIIRFKTKSSFS